MSRSAKSEKVPKRMQSKFDAITALADKFCEEHLNQEYLRLARQVAPAFFALPPSAFSHIMTFG